MAEAQAPAITMQVNSYAYCATPCMKQAASLRSFIRDTDQQKAGKAQQVWARTGVKARRAAIIHMQPPHLTNDPPIICLPTCVRLNDTDRLRQL